MPVQRRAIFRPVIAAFGLIVTAGAPVFARDSIRLPNTQMEPLPFTALDGWADGDHLAALGALNKSCGAILKGSKAMRAARPMFRGLYDACGRAVALKDPDKAAVRKFFEDQFQPVRISRVGESMGFLTGYYETEFEGSRFPSDEFSVPIYAKPSNLVMPIVNSARKAIGKIGRRLGRKGVVPYHNRTEIEDGILAGRSLEICWVKKPVDAFFAQIQGSTRVRLDTGKMLRLNYAAHNGLPYVPVGKFLIDRGIVSKEEMSMDKIRQFMEASPDEGKELRRKNQSFVFFREVELADHEEPVGAQGVPLTAGRSIAVDKNIHTYGTPFWIEAELPIDSEKPETKFRRLMVAQDTGSAILGPARADIYFGSGETVGSIAGRIKQFGRFVMLVPRGVPVSEPKASPLPKSKPAVIAGDGGEPKKDETTAGKPLPKPRPKT